MDIERKFNLFSNLRKAVALSKESWQRAYDAGIVGLNARLLQKNLYQLEDGHQFLHMCSCSYLGLDSHPLILAGAIKAIQEQRTASWIATSRNRLKLKLLEDLEDEFSDYFKVYALTATTCSSATAGLLPLLAAGLFTQERPPLMIFDKSAHFSMAHLKALCADETRVENCPPNDLNYIEDQCRQNSVVAYIGDGVNSVGGAAAMEGLIYLQQKYQLFLYLDDSHALSSYGKQGWGYVREYFPQLNDKTIVVASLAKAFGTSGGLVMFGAQEQKDLMTRYGGPNLWSQGINTAAIGSSLGSLKIHSSATLAELQHKLNENIKLFDELIDTKFRGNPFTIRVIHLEDDNKAIEVCKQLLARGFYTSAVFFPIVKKGNAGLRVMLRADMEQGDIRSFAENLKEVLQQ